MYTVLVVDDEPKHRKCLAEMIRTLRPDYQVNEAKNGNEALEFTRTQKTDIVITDIRMPMMDGLTFLEALNENTHNIKVIILSGFAYFEYAQKAVTLGAFDYVLKPVNESKISALLEKVEKAIKKEYSDMQEQISLKRQLNTALPAYINQKLNDWVKGFLNEDGLLEVEKIFPFKGQGFVLATEIIGLSDVFKDYSSDEIYEIKLNIKQWMKQALNIVGHTISFFLENSRNTMITILNTNSADSVQRMESKAVLDNFIQNIKVSYNLDVIIGVGLEYGNIFENAGLSFNEALKALNSKMEKTRGRISESPESLDIPQKTLTSEAEGIRISKNDKIIKECEKYVSQHYMEDIPLESMAEIFHFNASYFSSYFKSNTGVNFSDYLQKVRLKNAEELLKNYSLKIYEVAEMVGYRNVKYFNKVFKKEFGKSPDEYRRLDMRS